MKPPDQLMCPSSRNSETARRPSRRTEHLAGFCQLRPPHVHVDVADTCRNRLFTSNPGEITPKAEFTKVLPRCLASVNRAAVP